MLMLIFFEDLHHLVSCVDRRPLLSTFFRLPSQQLVLEINLWSTGTENQHKNAIKSTNITIGQILTSLSRGRLICSIGMLLTLFDPPYFEPFQTQGGGGGIDLPQSFFLNSQKSLIYDLVQLFWALTYNCLKNRFSSIKDDRFKEYFHLFIYLNHPLKCLSKEFFLCFKGLESPKR